MMRYTLFSLLISFLILPANAQELNVTSQIDSITLFQSGAQIHRTGVTQIQAGRTEVVFNGLSSEIDENSLRVSGIGKLTILSVSFRRNFLEQKEKEESLVQLEDEKYIE